MKSTQFDVQIRDQDKYRAGKSSYWNSAGRYGDLATAKDRYRALAAIHGPENVRIREVTVQETYRTLPPDQIVPEVHLDEPGDYLVHIGYQVVGGASAGVHRVHVEKSFTYRNKQWFTVTYPLEENVLGSTEKLAATPKQEDKPQVPSLGTRVHNNHTGDEGVVTRCHLESGMVQIHTPAWSWWAWGEGHWTVL